MSLELLKEKFGYSGVTKEVDNREKIHKKLNAEFNFSNGVENLKSFKSQDLLDLLKERFSHNDIQNLKPFKSQDLSDLLKERFGHSASTNEREADNREKIHEKLNDKFNSNGMDDLKSLNDQHQEQIEEKQKIIENLKIETSESVNKVLALEKEKAAILEELKSAFSFLWIFSLLSTSFVTPECPNFSFNNSKLIILISLQFVNLINDFYVLLPL